MRRMPNLTPDDLKWNTPNKLPIGDWLARCLERVGIRKRAGCKCAQRQRWLNRIGQAISNLCLPSSKNYS